MITPIQIWWFSSCFQPNDWPVTRVKHGRNSKGETPRSIHEDEEIKLINFTTLFMSAGVDVCWEMNLRVIEFFSGIGGWRTALNEITKDYTILNAYDINPLANLVYSHNYHSNPSNVTNCFISSSFLPHFLHSLTHSLFVSVFN